MASIKSKRIKLRIKLNHSIPILNHSIPILNHSIPILNHSIPILNHSIPILNHSILILNHSIPILNPQPICINIIIFSGVYPIDSIHLQKKMVPIHFTIILRVRHM